MIKLLFAGLGFLLSTLVFVETLASHTIAGMLIWGFAVCWFGFRFMQQVSHKEAHDNE